MSRAQLPRTARILGSATLLLVIVGCTSPAERLSEAPSSSLRASVSASAEPTASATPAPSQAPSEAAPSASAPGGRADIAEVVTTDLVMRSAPGTGPESEIYSPSLSAPMLLYILEGPVAADGYEWYRVAPTYEFYSDVGLRVPAVGWVAAAGQDGEVWVAPWTGECPAPMVEELVYRAPLVTLACFGETELTLEGTFRDCMDSPAVVSPSWLTERWCVLVPFGFDTGGPLPGFYFFHESLTLQVATGGAVSVTGHYDDPAALTCAADPQAPPGMFPPDLTVLSCRAKFVATEIAPANSP